MNRTHEEPRAGGLEGSSRGEGDRAVHPLLLGLVGVLLEPVVEPLVCRHVDRRRRYSNANKQVFLSLYPPPRRIYFLEVEEGEGEGVDVWVCFASRGREVAGLI